MSDDRLPLGVYTRYTRSGASSRLRFFMYGQALRAAGFDPRFHPFFDDGYLRGLYSGAGKSKLAALKAEAVNVILLHNHPSGDPSPSQTDLEVTERIARLGAELGIPLLDHVIIGDQKFYSFRQEGMLT